MPECLLPFRHQNVDKEKLFFLEVRKSGCSGGNTNALGKLTAIHAEWIGFIYPE